MRGDEYRNGPIRVVACENVCTMPDGQTQPLEPSISLPRRLGGEPGKTILIVDDAQFLGMGLQRALRTAGFESLCVTSGARALAAITSRPI